MTATDERCGICGEPRSAHVATDKGPLTHPREARGEGEYELVRPASTHGAFWPGDDDIELPPVWKFVPKTKETKTKGGV